MDTTLTSSISFNAGARYQLLDFIPFPASGSSSTPLSLGFGSFPQPPCLPKRLPLAFHRLLMLSLFPPVKPPHYDYKSFT